MATPARATPKVGKKYYFAPDVVALIEAEAERTGYPRSIVLEILIREKFGRPPVEEATAVVPSGPKPERKKRRPAFDPFTN
jgi:hypothetical protein